MDQHAHHTPLWAILLVLATTLLTSAAQGFFKLGATQATSLLSILLSLPLWGGLVLYGIAWVGLMVSLKHGELSVLYPLIAFSFVWVAGISWLFFAESITLLKIVGILAIMAGITCVGLGSNHGRAPEAA